LVLDFKNGTSKKRKLIAGEWSSRKNGFGFSMDLEMTFWTVMDIG
jgi:hypothetical protein